MGSGGQQPVTQQTTQTKDPWSAAQPHLQGIMNQAATWFGQGFGYNPYTGNTTAPWLNTYNQPGVSNIQKCFEHRDNIDHAFPELNTLA